MGATLDAALPHALARLIAEAATRAADERAQLLASEGRWVAEVDRLRLQLKAIEKERLGEASVASLIQGGNPDAVAYLRSQLGALVRIDSDQDAIRHGLGLSMDGMLAKGGSVERLRLPGAGELKIGASQTREQRQRLERERERAAEQALHAARELERIERASSSLRALREIDGTLHAVHEAMLLAGVLDNHIELFRDGDFVQVNQIEVRPAARTLMESDQFALHPELLKAEIEAVLAEQAGRERAADA